MKRFIKFTIISFVCAGATHADVEVTMTEVRRLGFIPQDKADYRPEEKINIKAYNPFAEKVKKVEAKTSEEQGETEESKIRGYLHKQKVTGIIKLGEKYIATVGPLIMEAGQTLPPLIPGQTQILRVMRVDKSTVEIGWVEGTPYDTAAPRKIVKKVDMTPRVEVQLLSSDSDSKEGVKNTYLVDDNGKLYVQPKTDLMPDPSEIAENLPPGSDTNPNSALNAEEQSQMNLLENEGTPAPFLPGAGPGDAAPPPPESRNTDDSDMVNSPGDIVPPAPPLPTEDEVQSDPDLETPQEPAVNAGKSAGAP